MVGLLAFLAFIWAFGLTEMFDNVWPIARPSWTDRNWYRNPAAIYRVPISYGPTFATSTKAAVGLLAAALTIVALFGGRQARFHLAFLSGLTLLIVTCWCALYTVGDAEWYAISGIALLEGNTTKITDGSLFAALLAILFGGSSAVLLLLTALFFDREPGFGYRRFR
jgi:hypothetical protein